jgi:peptidoglycan/LPS O-acetylase OafA/YrhL
MHDGGVLSAGASPRPLGTVRRPEIRALTSIRALAALEVVLLHTLFELGGKPAEALPSVVSELLTHGGMAVSFFFVLSGFILTYTYCEADGGLRGTRVKFWRARVARIYPLYFLAFLVDAPRVISFFFASATSLVSPVAKVGVAGLAYLMLIQSWHPRVSNTWNTPGWSLSTEAFFYAIFPALLAAIRSWSLRRTSSVALVLWALPLVAYTLVAHTHLVDLSTPSVQTFWRSFPPLRVPEFALGVVACRWLLTGRLPSDQRWLGGAGALALLVILALPVCARVLPATVVEMTLGAPLFALAILAVAAGALPTPRWLSAPTLVLLGQASYAVYIMHQPFKTVFLAVAQWLGLAAPSPGLLLTFLLTLELLSIGLFRWFEDPLRRLITKAPTLVR